MRAFLSHSSRNKSIVDAVANSLGDQVEIDSVGFDSGVLNVEAISTALKRSILYILFLTDEALESDYVRFEARLAQELIARGQIDRFIVICSDSKVFSKAEEAWKSFSFTRYITSAASISRFIQHQIILARARFGEAQQPVIDRLLELEEIKRKILKPDNVPLKGIFLSGNVGIGRRTFAKSLYSTRYPAINQVFADINIDIVDGYEEIFRKLYAQLAPNWTVNQARARLSGFAIATEIEKTRQAAELLSQLTDAREAIFLRDAGGLLTDEGALQVPLSNIIRKMETKKHPTVILVAERMIPSKKRNVGNIVYQRISSFSEEESSQLAGFLLADAGVSYDEKQLEQISALSDGHPFNVRFIVESAKEYGLAVALSDTSELTKWKRKRGGDYLRSISINSVERLILAALKDFPALTFDAILSICGENIIGCGAALSRLLDLHIVEETGNAFQISPPLKSAIERHASINMPAEERRDMLNRLSFLLSTFTENDNVSLSLVESGIVASLQSNKAIPPLFETFLLPSHYVWLAKRHYDTRQWAQCMKFAELALPSVDRLSPAGKVEACRLLCLSAARMNKQFVFDKGMRLLKTWAGDRWARSNVHFLLGFNFRLEGHLPDAEVEFRLAYTESPGNFNAVRELAAICLARNEMTEAEGFAREALQVAADNPYVLDVLVNILIKKWKPKNFRSEPELELLFGRLAGVGDAGGHSFYTTRLAQYELKKGNISESFKLIDKAARATPGIFDVHATRAEIYLEGGIKAVAADEIEWMRKVVYRAEVGERRSNKRRLLEIEAEYLTQNGEYDEAKTMYADRSIFTIEEEQRAVRTIDFYRSTGH